MNMQELIDQLAPLLSQAMSIIGLALLAWIGKSVRRWAKATDERTQLERVHADAEVAAFAAASLGSTTLKAVASEATDAAVRNQTGMHKLGYTPTDAAMIGHAKALKAFAALETTRNNPATPTR